MHLTLLLLVLAAFAPVEPGQISQVPTLGILRSQTAQARFEAAWNKNPTFEDEVSFWERAAGVDGVSYRVFGDLELARGAAAYQAVVVPYPDLGDEARWEQLMGVVGRARRVLVLGDRAGEGRGFLERMQPLCDLGRDRAFQERMGRYFALKARTFLNLDQKAAFRFEVEADVPMFLADSAKVGLAWWVQWGLGAYSQGAPYEAATTMVAGRCGLTEVVWVGFPLSGLVDGAAYDEANTALVRNLWAWLLERPLVGKVTWRDDRELAVVVEADVEDQFYNASAFAAVLKKERVRGTFFLLGVEAEKNPEVVKELAEVGEIGSHSMRHEDFTQKSEADQRQELKETVDLMHRLGVAQVVGFRPPFEGYNEATLHMLADSGMRFIYGSEDFVAAWPREVRYDDHWFYQFPRIVRDDYNIVAEKQSEAPEAYLAAFREDLAFMRRFGGLYPFSAHTNYLMKPDALPAVSGFLAEVRRTDVWLATLSEVVDWVEERRDVSVTCTEKECRVRNGGARAVTRFPLAAYRMGLTVPPALANKVIALPRTDGGTILAFDLQPSEEVALPLAPAR